MTGWQGGDGWGQQPDPYGQQYQDPYAQPQQQAYGQPQQPPGTPPYGVPYGQPGYQPGYAQPPFHEPPKPSKLPAIIGTSAIVLIVAAVVAIFLLNQDDPGTTADPGPSTTADAPPTTGSKPKPTTRPTTSRSRPVPTTTDKPVPLPDGKTVDNSATARLIYTVPNDWAPKAENKLKVQGVEFSGYADFGAYQCGGSGYTRTFAVSAAVQAKDNTQLDLEKTARTFAQAFGGQFFPGSDVALPAATPTTVDGKKALVLTAGVTPKVTKPDCEATSGEVVVLAVDLANGTSTQGPGVALLIVTNDLAGGPATPGALPASLSQQIIAGAKIK